MELAMQEWWVRLRHGQDALIYETDPTKIAGSIHDVRLRNIWVATKKNRFLPRVAKSGLNRLARHMRKFRVDDERFVLGPFEHGKTYKLMNDIWTHRAALEGSSVYFRVAEKLAVSGVYRHKRFEISSESQIIAMMQACYLDLLNSMAEEGYVVGKTSSFGTGGIGKVIVWRDGSLWHENGATHRLAAARIVGLRSGFPLKIVAAHRDWLDAHGVNDLSCWPKLTDALSKANGVLGKPIGLLPEDA
jgi:hypothetical protein